MTMRERTLSKLTLLAVPAVLLTLAGCARDEGTLAAAAKALGAHDLKSIEFAGNGHWFQFGQAPAPDLAWPRFDVSSYTAAIDYTTPASHVQITRKQALEAGRDRPVPVEQKPDQYLQGERAWNLAVPQGQPADTQPVVQPQSAAVEERIAEIWTTPQGFLKAALANSATSKKAGDGSEITFNIGNHRYLGIINASNEVERVQTWIDNPVLGDLAVEYRYDSYRDFGGVKFPSHIVRTQGGHPVLDLTVTSVTPNAPVTITTPQSLVDESAPAVAVTAERLAAGVFYLRGGTHHSVAVEQQDRIVVIEAPLSEQRSVAVIAKVKELFPNKPIGYLVNTHVHFDHSGGLRTYVDEGATIVTHELNRPYYEQAWAAPRTLNPDRLAKSGKTPTFATFSDKYVLADDRRAIEVHLIQGNSHNDAFALIYLPAEKILIEADAYTPLAAGAPPPAQPNPYSVSLYCNIERLKLDVRQIAALHGPRVATLADLRADIGEKI